jgi:hypothetical protein
LREKNASLLIRLESIQSRDELLTLAAKIDWKHVRDVGEAPTHGGRQRVPVKELVDEPEEDEPSIEIPSYSKF